MTIFVIVGVVIVYSFLHRILSNFLVAAPGAAVFADVTSANVVGYSNVQPRSFYGSGNYTAGGSAFLSLNGTGYCLNDFKIVDGSGDDGCRIQFLQTTASKVDDVRSYYWFGGVPGMEEQYPAGWQYYKSAGGHTKGNYVSNTDLLAPIPVGTGFLVYFKTAAAKLQYTGQVNGGSEGVINCARAGTYTFVANPCPYAVKLRDVTIVNGSGDDGCRIQFLQTTASKVDDARSYYWFGGVPGMEEQYPAGWQYFKTAGGHTKGAYVSKDDLDTEEFKAGEAVLFYSKNTSSSARVQFKAPAL